MAPLANETLEAVPELLLEGCRGTTAPFKGPSAGFPLEGPPAWANQYPDVQVRLVAFRCEVADAFGVATFDDVSLALQLHTNFTPPADAFHGFGRTEMGLVAGIHAWPPEFAAELDAIGIGQPVEEGEVAVDGAALTVAASNKTGGVSVECSIQAATDGDNQSARPVTLLAVTDVSQERGLLLDLNPSFGGVPAGVSWSAHGDWPLAQWAPIRLGALYPVGTFYSETTIRVGVIE